MCLELNEFFSDLVKMLGPTISLSLRESQASDLMDLVKYFIISLHAPEATNLPKKGTFPALGNKYVP